MRERARAMLEIEDILARLNPADRALLAFDIYRTYANTSVKRRVKHVSNTLLTPLDNTVDNTDNTSVNTPLGGAIGGVPEVPASKNRVAIELLEFLNVKTGRNYRPVEENLRFIRARLNTATPEDIKGVIVRKTREWLNTDHGKYLRPATLFNATKFEQYIGEQGSKS